jgi:microsomal dipeptidase-like Zn-dependent dipeptidase
LTAPATGAAERWEHDSRDKIEWKQTRTAVLKRGYSDRVVGKIIGGNLTRLFREVTRAAG